MAGLFSRLFGKGAGAAPSEVPRGEGVAYKGCMIHATPQKDSGGWRTAGVIVKQGSEHEHPFIRADVFSSREEADACSIRKGKQIIDERGDNLFADTEQAGDD